MGRDFEITSYFPHQPLTPRLVRRLFRDLAAAGLRVGAPDSDHYPVLDGLKPAGENGVRVSTDDVEDLLRSRSGPLQPGYGVIPLRGKVPGFDGQVEGTMQFSVHSPAHPELDGVHIRFDDASLRLAPAGDDKVGPGWRALLTWYGVLADTLRVAYGYGDWEDLFLQTAIPASRREVLAGLIDMLYRVNYLGPRLVERLGRSRVLSTPANAVVALRHGGVLIGGKLTYEGGGEEGFRLAAEHLGLRSRANEVQPSALEGG